MSLPIDPLHPGEVLAGLYLAPPVSTRRARASNA